MSQQERAGQTIRQAYSAFWKEWIILAIGVILIGQPGLIVSWAESKVGPEAFEGLPIEMIIRGAGILAAIYALVFKIGYDLLANRYTLTEEEVVEVYGIIQKDRRVTKLEHIRRVGVEIGIVGRILGFGDVLYYTAGSGGVDVRLKDIPNPEALAKEADALAKRKQDVVKEDGGGARATKGSAGGAQASGQILDAFRESVTESVAVQREILEAINALRAETRSSAAALQSAMRERPVPTESYPASPYGESGEQVSGQPAAESEQDESPKSDISWLYEEHGADKTDFPLFKNTETASSASRPDDLDMTSATDSEGSPSEQQEDPYASSPKMFDDDWEDILAPGKEPEETERGREAVERKPDPAPAQPEEPAPESDSESERSESSDDNEKSDGPVSDDEFIGIMSPRKK